MKSTFGVVIIAAAAVLAATIFAASTEPIPWAYAIPAAPPAGAPPATRPRPTPASSIWKAAAVHSRARKSRIASAPPTGIRASIPQCRT